LASLECDIIVDEKYANNNILLELNKHGVASITLNRVEKHNALDANMIAGLNKAFDFLENYLLESEHPVKIRLLLLKANGKTFCAGADLNSMQKMVEFDYDDNYQDAINLARVLDRLNNFACPTIAVVQGSAFGGGVGLICCCDIAVAVSSAKFCLSEVKLGLIPAVISPYLVAAMGLKHAKRYTLTAEKFNSETAYNISMLTEVASNEKKLDITVDNIVSNLLKNGPVAMQKAKSLLKTIEYDQDEQNLASKTADAIANIRVSPEGQEGLLAFLEKRKPNWQ